MLLEQDNAIYLLYVYVKLINLLHLNKLLGLHFVYVCVCALVWPVSNV